MLVVAEETTRLILRRDAQPKHPEVQQVGESRGRRTMAGAAKSETAFSHEGSVMWREERAKLQKRFQFCIRREAYCIEGRRGSEFTQ